MAIKISNLIRIKKIELSGKASRIFHYEVINASFNSIIKSLRRK